MLSAQELFIQVSAHLLAQRVTSEDENGTCRLRGSDGRKCAIGSLIHDDKYCHALEGLGIAYFQNATDGALLRALFLSDVDVYDQNMMVLLTELELVHDDVPVDEWPHALARLGQRHSLI